MLHYATTNMLCRHFANLARPTTVKAQWFTRQNPCLEPPLYSHFSPLARGTVLKRIEVSVIAKFRSCRRHAENASDSQAQPQSPCNHSIAPLSSVMSKRPLAASGRPSTRLQKKHRVDEDVGSWIEAKKAERPEYVNALNKRRGQLAPLPAPVPRPAYDFEPRVKSEDESELADFFRACASGDEDACRRFITKESPSQPELAFALEEASFHFQIPVVKFLLQHTPLHFRCFRRSEQHPDDLATNEYKQEPVTCVSQSVFSSGSSKLLPLLEIFLEHGWHPNQVIGPLQENRPTRLFSGAVHEVALHYPRCIADTAILKLLLEAGADPTIAREQSMGDQHNMLRLERPVRRLDGFSLDKAINVGTPEAVDLILAHGASVEMGLGLYTLAPPYRSDGSLCLLSELQQHMNGKLSKPWEEHKEVALQLPESPFPEIPLEARLAMASHLLSRGADINQLRNM